MTAQVIIGTGETVIVETERLIAGVGSHGSLQPMLDLLLLSYRPTALMHYDPSEDLARFVVSEMGGDITNLTDPDPLSDFVLSNGAQKGGPGSGHHGHSGRPGHRGGSAPGSGIPASIRARAANPYVGVPEDVLQPGEEAFRVNVDLEQPTGAPIRGKAIRVDDSRIPDTVYHMTTDLPAVQQSGVLLAKGTGGLGGDQNDQIVSMTISKDIAYQLAEDTKFVALLADRHVESQPPYGAFGDPDRESKQAKRAEWGGKLIADMKAQAMREGWEYNIDSDGQLLDYGFEDWIGHYFRQRDYKTGKTNPIFWSTAEELLAVGVDDIGVIAIPKQNLKTGALLTDFDLGQKFGLEEVRLYGDVPLQNATYAAVKQLSESFFDLQEEDMKEIVVLIDDTDIKEQDEPSQMSFADWNVDIATDSKTIRKEGGKWYLYTHDGSKRLGGPYDSREEAVKRERQVQFFKHGGKDIDDDLDLDLDLDIDFDFGFEDEKAEPRETGDSFRVRLREPGTFQEGSFRTITIDEGRGIKAVIGRLKGESTTTTQTYIFDKKKWTSAEAQKWVSDHQKKGSKKARGEGQGVGGQRQGDGGASTCVCPECGHKAAHERGQPCSEKSCPECGSKMVGSDTGAETTTVMGNAGRALIAGNSSGIEAQVKEDKNIGQRILDEFKALKGALRDLIISGTGTGGSDISNMLTQSIAVKAMAEASEYGSSLVSFKGLDGQDWLLTFTTNAFEDREGEIFATHSIKEYVDRHIDDDIKGEYQFWHLPGSAFGDIRWQAMIGRFLVEAGTYRDTPTGRAFKEFFDAHPSGHPDVAPTGWGCSHRYEYKSDDRADGVYNWFEKSETTVLPIDAAANQFTRPLFLSKENATMNARQKKALEIIGGDDLVQIVETVGEGATRELEKTVAFKETDDLPAKLLEYAEDIEDDDARAGVESVAKAMKKMPPWLMKKPEDEEDGEEEEEGKAPEKKPASKKPAKPAKKKQAEEVDADDADDAAGTDDADTEADAAAPAEAAPAEAAPAADAPAPEVTGDKEYQDAVAESFKMLAGQMQASVSALSDEIKQLKDQLAQVSRDDEEKIAEKAALTPAASLLDMVSRAVGSKEAQVDGRSSFAKDGPKQTDPNEGGANGPSRVPMLNVFMSGEDQRMAK